MATVSGITVERAQEIEDASISSGHIASGNLYLTTHGGATINAGSVATPAVNSWPIGSIFMSVVATNPATLLGGGTWVQWGEGRVPVSINSGEGDPAETRFETVEETGIAVHEYAASPLTSAQLLYITCYMWKRTA